MMQGKVDYRLLERFRAKRQLNVQPEKEHDRRRAATADGRRLPAIGLRD